MASARLLHKAFGAAQPCCSGSLPESNRIQCGSAFLVGRESSGGLSARLVTRRGGWSAMKMKRRGVDLVIVGAQKANPEGNTGSVAVEDVADDVSEEQLSPEEAEDSQNIQDILQKANPEGTTGSIAVEDVADDFSEEQLSPEEAEDRQNIQNILQVVELLRTKRDMTFNEVRLTVMIEDPRDVERRRMLNIEDDRGCSREEMGNALLEVYEGRVPEDRVTLQELAKEMLNWPNLEDEIAAQERLPPVASPYAKATDTGVDPRLAAERAKVDWDSASDILPGEEKKDISEVLPPVVGFSFLYLISALPVLIGIAVVVILFLNSLQ